MRVTIGVDARRRAILDHLRLTLETLARRHEDARGHGAGCKGRAMAAAMVETVHVVAAA